MQGQELLSSFIEVGIGIAGFSSVVAAISRQNINEKMRLAFIQLWIQSAGIIMFSTIPLLLFSSGISEINAYVIGSYFYATWLAIVIFFSPVRRRFKLHPTLLVITINPIIALFNAVYLMQVWPYLSLILLGIAFAFITFFELIREMWAEKT